MAVYDPSIFDCKTLEQAKFIIMTPEAGVPTETRWDAETQWLMQLLIRNFKMDRGLILDFGCGIGRVAKPLTELGHFVVGVDASADMRLHAAQQQLGERFSVISPKMLDRLSTAGVKFDLALSIWVLQHCFDLEGDAMRVINAIKPGGGLFIVDMNHRAVPTDQGWVNDNKSVFDFLCQNLTLVERYKFNPPNAPGNLMQNAWVAYFRKDY